MHFELTQEEGLFNGTACFGDEKQSGKFNHSPTEKTACFGIDKFKGKFQSLEEDGPEEIPVRKPKFATISLMDETKEMSEEQILEKLVNINYYPTHDTNVPETTYKQPKLNDKILEQKIRN